MIKSISVLIMCVCVYISSFLQITSGQSIDIDNTNTTANGQINPLELNAAAFDGLRYRFGNFGTLLYSIFTNPNALGNQMSELSRIMAESVGAQNYMNAINTVLDLFGRIDVQSILSPIIGRIQDIRDDSTGISIGEALQILNNIFTNGNAIQLMQQRFTTPLSSQNTITVQQ